MYRMRKYIFCYIRKKPITMAKLEEQKYRGDNQMTQQNMEESSQLFFSIHPPSFALAFIYRFKDRYFKIRASGEKLNVFYLLS